MKRKRLFIFLISLVAGAVVYWKFAPEGSRKIVTPEPELVPKKPSERTGKPETAKTLFPDHAGSQSCRGCHQEIFESWQSSHHARAERKIDKAEQAAAFVPHREIKHASQQSTVRLHKSRYELTTMGPDGRSTAYHPERVFGVAPLYQFVVPFERGRFQVTELAFDPGKKEWFDVFGDEDRVAGEWGHWTGLGMNWNSMCAYCHNTSLVKNYDEKSDTYDTRMAEMGVGCESCHGPLRKHVEIQNQIKHSGSGQETNDVSGRAPQLSHEGLLATCGSCHSRRTELTDDFRPGEEFLDHYIPILPGIEEIYYPDGQVREENFEYTSFLTSVMHSKGVRCIDCHDPHSARTKLQGNALCLQCHREKIDPAAHSHHTPGTPGGNCVDCHMPLTTYMQRHPRHDHGFTIPDPKLTKEHGVPNACNRCHEDRDTDWAIAAVEKWYGAPWNRPSQKRARIIAEARQRSDGAKDRVVSLVREETIPLWRASAVELLEAWITDPEVRKLGAELARDPHPLVRTAAARLLDAAVPFQDSFVNHSLRSLTKDPLRAVRIESAWSLRREVDPGSAVGDELWSYLKLHLDQPGGLLRMGAYHMDRNHPKVALPYLRRSVHWDPRSPAFREALALCMSRLGNAAGAARELQVANDLEPESPSLAFLLGLALAEVDNLESAAESLKRATELDPDFSRAWYNLALTLSKLGRNEEALKSLYPIKEYELESPDILFAKSSILHHLSRDGEAIEAARRAVELNPERPDIRRFLNYLEGKDEAVPVFEK